MKSLFRVLAFSIVLSGSMVLADPPASRPATQAATQPAARMLEAKISPEARAALDRMTSAYGKLTSFELAGTTSFDGDISGKKEHETNGLTANFIAPNQFRHEMKGNMIAGSTGEKAYAFSVEDNTFVQKDAPKGRVASGDAPRVVWEVVILQNPSLAMALSTDAANQLVDGATAFALNCSKEHSAGEVEKGTEITRLEDVKVEDKSFNALKLVNFAGEFTYLIDPGSHLLRQVSIDQVGFFTKLGQADVKRATTTIDYTAVSMDAKRAENQFAWVPPVGARELTAALAKEEGNDAAMALVGKPAPDFKLKDLKNVDVSLAEQKGSVVIVDFWATWCGPCVQALPQLNQLYEDKKGAGLKVFAVSVDDDKTRVPPFVEAKNLTLRVLLDNDEQKAAEKFGVQGIPQTVIIGKDGVVKKVYVGFGPGMEDEMRKIVEEAMK